MILPLLLPILDHSAPKSLPGMDTIPLKDNVSRKFFCIESKTRALSMFVPLHSLWGTRTGHKRSVHWTGI